MLFFDGFCKGFVGGVEAKKESFQEMVGAFFVVKFSEENFSVFFNLWFLVFYGLSCFFQQQDAFKGMVAL